MIEIVTLIDKVLSLLKKRFGPFATPLLLGGYLSPRSEVLDTWSSIKSAHISRHFPRFIGLDLPGALLQNNLVDVIPLLRSCKIFFGTSYHVTFFMKMLGVPALLLVFNDYYRQKAAGIEKVIRSPEGFLHTDPSVLLGEQAEILSMHRKARCEYLTLLGEVLNAYPQPKNSIMRRAVYFWKKAENQERIISELEAQISLIQQSRGWKIMQKYWTLTTHPFWHAVLSPVRALAKLLVR